MRAIRIRWMKLNVRKYLSFALYLIRCMTPDHVLVDVAVMTRKNTTPRVHIAVT